MQATIDEVGPDIYRISINIPADAVPIPGGFTFNQYLIKDEQPLLFHTGARTLFPLVKEMIAKVLPPESLRFIGFSHYEQDECGALNEFLALAPQAKPICSSVGAMINAPGMDVAPMVLSEKEDLALGKKTVRWIDAPHLPHGWDCGFLFEQTTKTLFCGDLFTQPGSGMAPVTESDILGPSEVMRQPMDYFAHGKNDAAIFAKLAQTEPQLLACMHGSAWRGNGAALLRELQKTIS